MKTVKQVAELTGVSVRTLQYYDEIGVFKPTKISGSGYRLYDDEALKVLQQILLYKELDFQLSDIKNIMENSKLDKMNAFKKQKELIKAKRDRLNGLLALLEKLEKGETCMSFKEFDLSDYISALEKFKEENTEEVIKNWGSVEAFDQLVTKIKKKEPEVAKSAIMLYGSIEKYTEAMNYNLAHLSDTVEKIKQAKEISDANLEKSKALTEELVSDLTVDVKSSKIQNIIHELVQMSEQVTQRFNMGRNFWDILIDGYLHEPNLIATIDGLYGEGASDFIGKAYKYYFKK